MYDIYYTYQHNRNKNPDNRPAHMHYQNLITLQHETIFDCPLNIYTILA